MIKIPAQWDMEADVVVVGSGAAGLTAAIVAHDRGARVAVLERTDKIGGASACSGGVIWIPLNHHMAEIGMNDSKEEAMTYLRRLASGCIEDSLLEAFIDNGHVMVRYIEENTPARFEADSIPDYRSEFAGAKNGGRGLDASLFNSKELGDHAVMLRQAPQFFMPMTIDEAFIRWNSIANPNNIRFDIIEERMEQGILGMGMALIASLYKGCLNRCIDITMEVRAKRLIVEDGAVVGLLANRQGKDLCIKAVSGVILACGGFEWNDDLKCQFLPGPITHPVTPPYCEGDGLKMVMEVGAKITNMTEAWWMPALQIPGEEYEGKQLSRVAHAERSLPHSIMVNRRGRRYANESMNYNDFGKAFYTVDLNSYEYANYPTWIILDSNFRQRYAIMTVMPGDPDPEWLDCADSLADLARKVGIDPQGLEETVKRFNSFAAKGVDEDFHRGETAFDRCYGDARQKPNPNLGPIEKPPFYALPIYRGALGTKGGPKVNSQGQVLDVHGEVISGLYAAGNVMPAVSGRGYGGSGGTLGPAMTWAFICGNSIPLKTTRGSRNA